VTDAERSSQPTAPSALDLLRQSGESGAALYELIQRLVSEDDLDAKTRELCFVAIQTALRMPTGAALHARLALEASATAEEIMAALLLTIPYAGTNGALLAVPAVVAVLQQQSR
jgi:alkylhydroperoxidase/carboxymuconolactone decarboxylase family protein YurZ